MVYLTLEHIHSYQELADTLFSTYTDSYQDTEDMEELLILTHRQINQAAYRAHKVGKPGEG